jgi:nicotinamidase-related amidase
MAVVVKILGVGVHMANAILDPITADNSVVLLVDYQRAMFAGIGSGDRDAINTSAVATFKAARILDIPVVMSSIWEGGNGPFVGQLTEQFPNEKVLERSSQSFDALEDDAVSAAVKATGRKKLIVSGLWTSMCFAFTALHGVRDGYEVYGLVDAAGDATADAHSYGLQRMYQAGVVPITWMPLVSHWMHDWNNPKAGDLKAEVFGAYDAILAM